MPTSQTTCSLQIDKNRLNFQFLNIVDLNNDKIKNVGDALIFFFFG